MILLSICWHLNFYALLGAVVDNFLFDIPSLVIENSAND